MNKSYKKSAMFDDEKLVKEEARKIVNGMLLAVLQQAGKAGHDPVVVAPAFLGGMDSVIQPLSDALANKNKMSDKAVLDGLKTITTMLSIGMKSIIEEE